MKILWYVNVLMPDVEDALGFKKWNSGSWLVGSVESLRTRSIQLTIVTVSPKVKQLKKLEVNGILYYIVPQSADFKGAILGILQDVHPELVHIFGTEYRYNTELIHICKAEKIKSVVSLQGIMVACAEHYMDGIPEQYKRRNPLLLLMKKVYYADCMAEAQHEFEEQGKREVLALQDAEYVIGRTSWDREYAVSVNPNLKYFHVNENLRPIFYEASKWNYDACQKHMIFVSQGSYPIKGLHMLLQALPMLVEKYPDLQVYIGGAAPYTLGNAMLDVIVDYFFEYQAYIKKLIKKYKLAGRVHYTGSLPAKEMIDYFLRCNVFVSASSIENESNSVSEAKMLGVPVVASRVGGVQDRITDGVNGLMYDYYDTKSLQKKIIEIFNMEEHVPVICENARLDAQRINNCELNTEALLSAYREIIEAHECT